MLCSEVSGRISAAFGCISEVFGRTSVISEGLRLDFRRCREEPGGFQKDFGGCRTFTGVIGGMSIVSRGCPARSDETIIATERLARLECQRANQFFLHIYPFASLSKPGPHLKALSDWISDGRENRDVECCHPQTECCSENRWLDIRWA